MVSDMNSSSAYDILTFFKEHIGATSQFLAINENEVPKVIDKIIRADYKK